MGRYGYDEESKKPIEPVKPRQAEMQQAQAALITALEPLTDDERKRVIQAVRIFLGISRSED